MPTDAEHRETPEQRSLVGRVIGFWLRNKLLAALLVLAIAGTGLLVMPFDWEAGEFEINKYPVATDAIPDIGENQQIVFTPWPGRSPKDVDDQVTYPMTVALLGLPGVKTIRSYSMFGFSTIYIIFEPGIEFYWSRSRVLEKLNSLPPGTLPPGVRPGLGPDATALGQIYWYTLEGRDPEGNPTGGWDLEERRTWQDWDVRYALMSASGVAEVASVGGYVREYQIDVDPDAMRYYDVTLPQVLQAVRMANLDVGARSIELNRVEYFIRGIGFVEAVDDIRESVVKVRDGVPVLVRHVAEVSLGPATRRGALDSGGAEAVGGVVVARYGANPLEVIENVKAKIPGINEGLPTKAVIDFSKTDAETVRTFAARHGFEAYKDGELDQHAWIQTLEEMPRDEWPAWATLSQLAVEPFYDRTGLIHETLGTLEEALSLEILITLIVVILMVLHLRSSLLVGSMLPLAVLFCFIFMKAFGVDANIVALSGIAIAIGTIVDMGIVVTENILRHSDAAPPGANRLQLFHRAASEVGGAVLTAVLTTVVSFLPVFVMTGAEGKLFKPLAFTKTFALIASILIALLILPAAAHTLFSMRVSGRWMKRVLGGLVVVAGVVVAALVAWWVGVVVALPGLYLALADFIPDIVRKWAPKAANVLLALVIGVLLAQYWEPLGPEPGFTGNLLFVALLVGVLLGFFRLLQWVYPYLLRWFLVHKLTLLALTGIVMIWGGLAWVGWDTAFGWATNSEEGDGDPAYSTTFWATGEEAFPGLGKEFMPPLDEGSFLFMPTTMVHASIGEALDILAKQDQAIQAIPEVSSVVGKIGRAETPLDPAPISMVETVVNYKPEYRTDASGHRLKFRYDEEADTFVRDERGELIPDPDGRPYRQWRDKIQSPDDIWDEIVAAAKIPGTTSAPELQPIAARLVMLQSGMRAPMGVKVKGPDLATIERVGVEIESLLKEVPSVRPQTVIADRIVGKPYLEIVPDRAELARYGVEMQTFQNVVQAAIGGQTVTTTVEGRERFPVRVRYQRELRDQIETMRRVLVPGADGAQVPLEQVAAIRYVRGPQVIKSEDTFLTGYVVFDKKPGYAEVDVVEECQAYLEARKKDGTFEVPEGVRYEFAGNYENQIRSRQTLMLILPLALLVIFLILYFQFRSVPTTALVFSGIFVAWAGGFILLWLYGQDWFLDFEVLGTNMRDLFQIHEVNLSVAVWVGFLALFGIASDNGVIFSTYLDQVFRERVPGDVEAMREATVEAAVRRIRPCLMTTATTILALIPVLTSTGRGADVMVPMAIPSFGGMLVVLISIFLVPVLYCAVQEFKHHTGASDVAVGVGVILTALLGFVVVAATCTVRDIVVRLKKQVSVETS